MSKLPDKTFVEHSKWLAFQENSFTWPKYWRAVIFKLQKVENVLDGTTKYLVLPRNPEYQKYVDDAEQGSFVATIQNGAFITLPPMHLDVAEFDTLEDIDQWAQVAWRIK
ncbi:MAG: hypothetical protein HXX17_08050 [Geobacteraceae bacterium]|nr:hypothetical protein [Geobacteraceae bacterium]